MSRKIINVNNPGRITENQEKRLMQAFEDFEGDMEIKVPQREHLGREFRKGVCCEHTWKTMPPQDDVALWFRKNFDEPEVETGSVCTTCGATCLTENDRIWAYDATSKAFGYPKKAEKVFTSMAEQRRAEAGKARRPGHK